LPDRKRIVVKIGSSLLANETNLTVRYAFIHGLLSDIASLRARGYEVVLTSSGSVALGLNMIGRRPDEAGMLDKQAAAACGQPLLINAYKQVGFEHGLEIAQLLVTVGDMEERRRFLNIRNTILRLFDRNVVPIVNENDTVTTEELRVGDNDRLAAKVAQMIQADHLVILTSVEGLYDRDPSEPGATLIETVEDVTQFLSATEGGTSSLGSGGMLTKLQAASMAQNAGCHTLIADGIIDRPLSSILDGERRHTRCVGMGTPAASWALWLTNRLQVAGSLVLSQDAVSALKRKEYGVSPKDVLSVQGVFHKGDVLHLYSEKDEEIARGLANFSSDQTLLLARNPGRSVNDLLGYNASSDLVNQENIVLLEDQHLPLEAPTNEFHRVETN